MRGGGMQPFAVWGGGLLFALTIFASERRDFCPAVHDELAVEALSGGTRWT